MDLGDILRNPAPPPDRHCPACGGLGYEPDLPEVECPACNGSGLTFFGAITTNVDSAAPLTLERLNRYKERLYREGHGAW